MMSAIYNFLLENHVLAAIEQAKTQRKSTLNLSSFEIKALPDVLFSCQDVLRLHLNKNEITCLDCKIMNLSALTTLTLDYNNLVYLPPEIGLLTNLKNLNLSHNPLITLLPEIGNLVNLEVLWCNKTNIESIPTELRNLKKLDTFGARGNKISHLPEELLSLPNLRWLTLENNKIKEVPENIEDLKKLIHLNLKGNIINRIPMTLANCKELRYLLLSQNQISELPTMMEKFRSTSLEIIDLRENPFLDNESWTQLVQSNPVIRVNNESPNRNNQTPELIVVGNNINTEIASGNAPIISVENFTPESERREAEVDDDSSGSSEDWENSVSSSDLDMTDSSEIERQDNEIMAVILPELSRFSSFGS